VHTPVQCYKVLCHPLRSNIAITYPGKQISATVNLNSVVPDWANQHIYSAVLSNSTQLYQAQHPINTRRGKNQHILSHISVSLRYNRLSCTRLSPHQHLVRCNMKGKAITNTYWSVPYRSHIKTSTVRDWPPTNVYLSASDRAPIDNNTVVPDWVHQHQLRCTRLSPPTSTQLCHQHQYRRTRLSLRQ